MFAALAWKEWREQRALLIAGTVLGVMLPALLFVAAAVLLPHVSGQRLVDVTTLAFLMVLWPVFAAATGAGTFASEASGRTTGFLLSRPASRARIWLTKVVVAAAVALAIMVISGAVVWLLQRAVGAPGAAISSLAVLRGYVADTRWVMVGIAVLWACFCAAAFLSNRVERSLVAATGGLAITGVLLALLALLSGRVGIVISVQAGWAAAETALAGALFLTLSLVRFTRAELVVASSARRTVSTIAVALVVIVASGFVPALYADLFVRLDRAHVRDFTLSPDGSVAVVTAAGYPAVMGSLWRLPDEVAVHRARAGQSAPDAGPLEPLRLTHRRAFSPFFSSDGEWVYYFTARPILGLQNGSVDLRAVRIDGSEDRLVIDRVGEIAQTRWDDAPAWAPGLVSPSGSVAGFPHGWWGPGPMVLDLQQGTVARLVGLLPDVTIEYDYSSGMPMAWHGDDLVLQIRGSRRDDDRWLNGIFVYDVDASRVATLFVLQVDEGERFSSRFSLVRMPAGGFAPGAAIVVRLFTTDPSLVGSNNEFRGLAAIDLASGDLRLIESFRCDYPTASASADGMVVAYRRFTSCEEDERGNLVGTGPLLVVRDLRSDTLAQFDQWGDARRAARFRFISVSPSGRRVFVNVSEQEDRITTLHLVNDDRTVTRLSTRHFVGAGLHTPYWGEFIDEDHVFLRYYTADWTRLSSFRAAAILDVNDGSIVHMYAAPRALTDPQPQ